MSTSTGRGGRLGHGTMRSILEGGGEGGGGRGIPTRMTVPADVAARPRHAPGAQPCPARGRVRCGKTWGGCDPVTISSTGPGAPASERQPARAQLKPTSQLARQPTTASQPTCQPTSEIRRAAGESEQLRFPAEGAAPYCFRPTDASRRGDDESASAEQAQAHGRKKPRVSQNAPGGVIVGHPARGAETATSGSPRDSPPDVLSRVHQAILCRVTFPGPSARPHSTRTLARWLHTPRCERRRRASVTLDPLHSRSVTIVVSYTAIEVCLFGPVAGRASAAPYCTSVCPPSLRRLQRAIVMAATSKSMN